MPRLIERIASHVGLLAMIAGCHCEGALATSDEREAAAVDATVEQLVPPPMADAASVEKDVTAQAEGALADGYAGSIDAEAETVAQPADADAAPADAVVAATDADAAPADAVVAATDAEAAPADADGGSRELVRVVDWSVRKRLMTVAGADFFLEEMLTDLGRVTPKPSRIVAVAGGAAPVRMWTAPEGTYISDFGVHPSGGASAVVLGAGGSVSLVRLDQALVPVSTVEVHDGDIAGDPHVSDSGVLDLVANQLTLDGARIASVGEDVVAVVFTSWNSVIAYRASFANGAWTEPRRTLVEPPVPLFPNLPIGGSFDTFGAMTAWYRCLLDIDEGGNAYVAVWANPRRIREHVTVFNDGLERLSADAGAAPSDSDVLLTKMDPGGARLWSRVVGTEHEDEPYALRARQGAVAVAGRARRLPGFDNTVLDAFIAVTSSDGAPLGARAIPFDQSSIALAVDSLSGGGWVLGGSDGWTQNPSGLSIFTFGRKLLFELPSLAADPVRLTLPPGPRHNEIRTIAVDGARIAFGGHEDGPLTHSGDGDSAQIHATGVIGSVER